jgi:hypothetical protein
MKATWMPNKNGMWRPCIKKCFNDIAVDSICVLLKNKKINKENENDAR